MNGICHWFYRVNVNDSRIRYCRNGSLCRYKHITQDEVEELSRHGNELIMCPGCNGRGVQEIKTYGLNIANSNVEIQCMSCDGRREVSKRQRILKKVANREWCRCDGRVDTHYYPDNTHPKCKKHCYVCVRCKGISQVG